MISKYIISSEIGGFLSNMKLSICGGKKKQNQKQNKTKQTDQFLPKYEGKTGGCIHSHCLWDAALQS